MQEVANGISETLGSKVRMSLAMFGVQRQEEDDVNERLARRIAELSDAPGNDRPARRFFRH